MSKLCILIAFCWNSDFLNDLQKADCMGDILSFVIYCEKKLPTMRICHSLVITINSSWWLLLSLSSNALSQHTAHYPAHPENSSGACVFGVSSRERRGQRETRDSMKCCCCSLCIYLLFVRLSSLVHRFVSPIHFTAAVQRSVSAVGLISDDLISSCKGRELTLQRS